MCDNVNEIIHDEELLHVLRTGKSAEALLLVSPEEYPALIETLNRLGLNITYAWPQISCVAVEINLMIVSTISQACPSLRIYGNRMVNALFKKEGKNDRPSSFKEDKKEAEEGEEDCEAS